MLEPNHVPRSTRLRGWKWKLERFCEEGIIPPEEADFSPNLCFLLKLIHICHYWSAAATFSDFHSSPKEKRAI